MISTHYEPEELDPTSTCIVEIDNQVMGRRHNTIVMRSRGETLSRLMAQYVEMDPATGELGWTDIDPLAQLTYGTCVYIHVDSKRTVVRIYATGDLETAKAALLEI